MRDDAEGAGWSWTDAGGTEWAVSRRARSAGVEPGWVLRSVGYAFVVHEDAADRPSEEALAGYVEGHLGGGGSGPATARLWRDRRSGIEWEVSQGAGEIVFRNGTEVVRAQRGDGQDPPREMSDEELRDALDGALEED